MKTRRLKRAPGELAGSLNSGFRDEHVGHQLIELYDMYVRFLRTTTHSKLMNLNLTQWRTLTLIRYNPNQTQRTLATAVRIDPSSMTPIVDFFEKKRWVRRRRSLVNRSAYGLQITAAGRKAYRLIEVETSHAEQLIASVLSAAGRRQLTATLRRLHTRLELATAPPSRGKRRRR
jgi:DNA-binding MarR family transcriptional regulator